MKNTSNPAAVDALDVGGKKKKKLWQSASKVAAQYLGTLRMDHSAPHDLCSVFTFSANAR